MLELAGRMRCRRLKMKYYLHEKNVHDNNTKSTNHYTPLIEHSNGKSTIWRCISYSRWVFSIAMFVYRRVINRYKSLFKTSKQTAWSAVKSLKGSWKHQLVRAIYRETMWSPTPSWVLLIFRNPFRPTTVYMYETLQTNGICTISTGEFTGFLPSAVSNIMPVKRNVHVLILKRSLLPFVRSPVKVHICNGISKLKHLLQ